MLGFLGRVRAGIVATVVEYASRSACVQGSKTGSGIITCGQGKPELIKEELGIRIARFLAGAGIASRRRCEELVLAGRVKVNGRLVTELGTRVDENRDTVEVDGVAVEQEPRYYVLLYKPVGYISAVRDPRGRPTVLDLIRDIPARLYPVGRLDYDTEGILLLSNDGEFTNCMTHPRHEINKEYLVRVQGEVGAQAVRKLKQGVDIGGFVTSPAQVKLEEKDLLRITIHEGKNRQVRRMCAAVGHPVLSLTRTGYAFLTLDGLGPGDYRRLEPSEVQALLQEAGR